MVITSLQEKQNRKFYVPIRPGNRGGWSLFQWQSVRDKPYRDREMYLGNSAVIGVLGKGGKWRKMDWYLKTQKKYNDPNLTSEQQEAIRKDMERMKAALGQEDGQEDDEKLTEEQMKEIMKRIKNKDQTGEPESAVGLGFDKSRVEIRAKPTIATGNANRLEGIDEIGQAEPRRKKEQKREKSEDSRSRSARKQKKSKKEKKKKQKKDKKHKRDRQRSRSRSQSSNRDRDRKRKDRSRQKQPRRRHQQSEDRVDRHRSKHSQRRHN